MEKLILLGGGGHCKACIDVIEQEAKYRIEGILDKEELSGQKVLEYEIIGTDHEISKLVNKGYTFLITVGQIQTCTIRKKLFNLLCKHNAKIATVISPRSYVSKHAIIGTGTIIMHDVIVNASASVGKNCIVNTKALIEHDVIIGDFCHVSTAAVLNGGIVVSEGSFFGSNSVSKEGIVIHKNNFIKAGQVVK